MRRIQDLLRLNRTHGDRKPVAAPAALGEEAGVSEHRGPGRAW